MRVSLLYDDGAGDGVSLLDIHGTLARHGHRIVQVVRRGDDVTRVLAAPCDLVVAAGGDGTAAAAARALAGRGVPLAILPLGTANNIARSLRGLGSLEDRIGRWNAARRQPIDLGTLSGARGSCRFVEAVGVGLIPAGMAVTAPPAGARPRTSKPADAARLYREALARLRPRRSTIRLDGVPVTGEFLLVEVLNIPSIGPNLVLSPDANPSDGFFSVVIAREHHRNELDRYLQHRIEGRECQLSLAVRRARLVEAQGWDDVHVDDRVRALPDPAVAIRVDPAAVEVLV